MKGLCHKFLFYFLFALSGPCSSSEKGLAIEPMSITLKKNNQVWVSVFNDTMQDYIITAQAISDRINSTDVPIVVNPPIRLLKKNDVAQIGVIYLPRRAPQDEKPNFYLSISFIPNGSQIEERGNAGFSLISVQQIPIIIQ
ncbi:fimbria/pilus periplasmic chaperone [Escherichia coli]|uniref:fimbria/pilus periplasmic chaperone n=1 Tax=Escherichia coli TaxID=562 RepID=UPI000E1CA67B|nr:fimbria/pilus periplasmic chaperone [Escherichia coli]EFH6920367.1 fimbria/pilus periplasmic chaperone [Escherichia coli]